MKLILLGPPGAGKGTLAEMLEERKGLSHISTGDLLRKEVKENTSLGKEAKRFMDKGLLVPDTLVVDVLKKNLNLGRGFVLDGFPRNINQAEMLEENGIDIDLAINLRVRDSTIISRLSGRRICSKCGKIYHLVNMPPKKRGICDICGGVLFQREDDKEDVIRRRLEIYRKENEGVIGYYADRLKLKEVDANAEAEETYKRLIEVIGEDGKERKN